jgi:hypothetical protein
MTNPFIIFARRDDIRGSWQGLTRIGFDSTGQRKELFEENLVIIIIADDDNLDDLIVTQVDSEAPLFGVEHVPLSEEALKNMKSLAQQYSCLKRFSSADENDPVYKRLRTILSDDNHLRAPALYELIDFLSATSDWNILNSFCILKQIQVLSPNVDAGIVNSMKEHIRKSEFGKGLLSKDAERADRRKPMAKIVDEAVAELQKAGAAE